LTKRQERRYRTSNRPEWDDSMHWEGKAWRHRFPGTL